MNPRSGGTDEVQKCGEPLSFIRLPGNVLECFVCGMMFEEGTKVTYKDHGKIESGIVKSLTRDNYHVFVAYNCNNDWDNYMDYTAQNTHIADLIEGWE